MAHAKLSLFLFSTLITALYLTELSVQFEGWSIHETKCSNYAEKVDSCWLEHSDVPSCDEDATDKLVECAEDIKNSARHCKDEIKTPINEKYEMYKMLHKTLCDNKELRDEFEEKPVCWHTARTCATRLAGMTDDSEEEVSEEECAKLLDALDNCNSIAGGCTDIQTNFTFEVFEASACVAHAEKLLSDMNASSITFCNSIIILLVTSLVASVNW